LRVEGLSKAKRARLTGKQQAFVNAYVANGFNGVRAARAAGYSGSYSALGVIAHDNLKNPKVRAELDKHFKQIAMGPHEVIARLTAIASSDLADVLNNDGSFDIKTARRRGVSYLIKEEEITEKFIPQEGKDDILIRTTKIKLHDAHAALNTLAKYHSLLSERLKVDDWRSEAVDALRKGEITPEDTINVFGDELAREFFALAGVKHG
jgi:phage terminase small subunit